MARLRTLYVGTRTVGDVTEHQHILILDKVDDPDQVKGANIDPDALKDAGIPPILAFDYEVDLPGTEDDGPGHTLALDVTGSNEDFKRMIRQMVRTGDPEITRAVREAYRESRFTT